MKLPGGDYSGRIRARFWLVGEDCANQTYIGIGRVELLEKINEYGSINRAAKEMGMSYKKAWNLVEEMNTFMNGLLVIKVQGGASGGGAELTPQGHYVIKQFRGVEKRLQAFLQEESLGLS